MVYYSDKTKKNEILPFATTCLDLEGIMLGKISQTKKTQISILFYMETIPTYISYMSSPNQ